MKMPALGKLMKGAKARKQKAVVVYLGDPEGADVKEILYEGFVTEGQFAEFAKAARALWERPEQSGEIGEFYKSESKEGS